jgi:transposase
VPLWGLAVVFVYALRRVDCPQCGVKVERVPWAEGKRRLTTADQWFLAGWAKHLSWKQTAELFHSSWRTVYRAVQAAVAWGVQHRSLAGIEAIGVDEVQWQQGHHYLTLVCQIDQGCRRLLYIGTNRTAKSLLGFFRLLGPARSQALVCVCSDMWQPYLKAIAKKAGQALHVLDRFPIMVHWNQAIDEVRRQAVKRLQAAGHEPVLKHARWCLLKRSENLTDDQVVKLGTLLKYHLQSVRAWLQREDFQRFWEYTSPAAAARFLKEWCGRAMRSRLRPFKRVVKMLRRHEPLILNWFRAKGTTSAGMVEGLNYNVKLTMRKAYGFQTETAIKTALYHKLGALPEPEIAHKFW